MLISKKIFSGGILNYPYFPLFEINIYFSNVKYSHDFTRIILLQLYVIANTELYNSVYLELLSVTSNNTFFQEWQTLLKKKGKETKSIKINLSINLR